MKKAIFCIDVFEDWFLDLPEQVTPLRTRDYRFYREHFGSSAYIFTNAGKNIPFEILSDLVKEADSVTLACSGGFDGCKEKLLIYGFDHIRKLAREYPGILYAGIWGESETHVYRGLPASATPFEAFLKYKKACFKYGAGCRAEKIECFMNDIEKHNIKDFFEAVYGCAVPEGFDITTFPDKVWGVHPHLEWGADGVSFERSGWNDNYQIAIAFLRGAARQYGRHWSIEMSPWGGSHSLGRGPTTFDKSGRHVAGVTASLTFFSWVSAMLSGSKIIRQQACECTLFNLESPTLFGKSNCDTMGSSIPLGDGFRKQDPGTTGANLSPVGEYAVKLAELNRREDFDLGEPIAPVAVMVELCHGWDASVYVNDNCVWGGSVPLQRGDRMMYELFEVLFPGYRQAGRMFDPAYNPDIPFSNEREMMQMFYDGMDMRPFERGIFAPSPFGDSFDVVTDGIDDKKLSGYPLVILAGRLSLNPVNLDKFENYVKNGGKLFLHSHGLSLYDESVDDNYKIRLWKFLGSGLVNDYAQGFSKTTVAASGLKFDEVKYEYTRIQLESATAVALNDQGDPLVTKNQFGKGEVYLGTAHHHLSLTAKTMLKGVVAVLADVMNPLLPAMIEGSPIQYQINKTDNGYLIGLFNWSEQVWNGTVELRGVKEIRQVDELLNNHEYGCKSVIGGGMFNATVKPYGIGLYKVQI